MLQSIYTKNERVIMTKKFEQLKAELDAAIMECIWVPNEQLPEAYHDDREGGRTLARLQQQLGETREIDPRESSVVISNGEIQHGNQERIDVLNRYRANVEAGEDIQYEENDYKLYRNQQAFAKAMSFDLEDDDDCSEPTYNLHYENRARSWKMGRNFSE